MMIQILLVILFFLQHLLAEHSIMTADAAGCKTNTAMIVHRARVCTGREKIPSLLDDLALNAMPSRVTKLIQNTSLGPTCMFRFACNL